MTAIHKGDWGYPIPFVITDGSTGKPLDLTNITDIRVVFLKPDKVTSFVRAGQVDGLPFAGKIRVEVQAGDFDAAGVWEVQVILASVSQQRSLDPYLFTVADNLPVPE